MFILLLLQVLDLRVTPFDLLVDKLHTLAHVLTAFLQLLAHQHGAVQLKDLGNNFRSV